MNADVKVTGMHCAGCESKIQKMLTRIDGIDEVVADRNDQKVSLIYNGSGETLEAAKEKITDLGYTVVE